MDFLDILKEYNYNVKEIKKNYNFTDDEICEKMISILKEKDFLEIENVSLIVQKHIQILFDISFVLEPKSFHVFIGENGAGKSTTIKIIIGQIENYTGNIFFNSTKKLNREKIFYIPDQQPKFPNVSIYQYLFQITSLLTTKSSSLIKSEINFWADKYGLNNILNRNINRLSTGQKQKVLIISVFLADLPYIILDEPFANLDPTSRYLFMNDLKKMSDKGTCIFLSTHIIDEIENYATHVTFIKKGKIIKNMTVSNPKEIHEYYLSHYLSQNEKNHNEEPNKQF